MDSKWSAVQARLYARTQCNNLIKCMAKTVWTQFKPHDQVKCSIVQKLAAQLYGCRMDDGCTDYSRQNWRLYGGCGT
jgi:hypothetical protein